MEPHEITPTEWAELRACPDVAEAFWLSGDETAEEFAGFVYGVRFNYQTDCPGYTGDLFLLKGGAAPQIPAVNVYRDETGKLIVADD